MSPEEFKNKEMKDELFDKRTTVEKLKKLRSDWNKEMGTTCEEAPFCRLLNILIAEREGTSRG